MKKDESFYCWICQLKICSMHEIAQGLCDCCKASIIRKNKPTPSRKELVDSIISESLLSQYE